MRGRVGWVFLEKWGWGEVKKTLGINPNFTRIAECRHCCYPWQSEFLVRNPECKNDIQKYQIHGIDCF